ncbi:uncharacterized protein METZ01_LOCUS131510 [marine metagenome]|jgi:hypothetical protein|uniref:DUF2905 domain-containing protein n=1 Tax=marine metagenome TaxID=408172 RepID=A0A381YNR5_9ZZZZ
MQKTIILIGLTIVVIGLAYPVLKRLPFGKLPGDIFYQSENFSFAFPVITCIVISIVLTIVINFFR